MKKIVDDIKKGIPNNCLHFKKKEKINYMIGKDVGLSFNCFECEFIRMSFE